MVCDRDLRLGQRAFGLLELGAGANQAGLGDARRRARGVDVLLRQQLRLGQLIRALCFELRIPELHLRLVDLRLQPRDGRARLLDLALEQRLIERGDHLPTLDHLVEVGADRGDRPRHLRPDFDGIERQERAGGIDGGDDIAAGCGGKRQLGRRGFDIDPYVIDGARCHESRDADHPQ